jgi:hypothetical protein
MDPRMPETAAKAIPSREANAMASRLVHHEAGEPSGLSDGERQLLLWLAINNLVRQFPGATRELAAEALDHFGDRGEVRIVGDRRDVYLVVAGAVHIHAERDWLRFQAGVLARQRAVN